MTAATFAAPAKQSHSSPAAPAKSDSAPLSRLPASESAVPQQGACACGGGCPRCSGANLMPKLAVSMPDDPLEREADRIADAVTSSGGPLIQTISISSARSSIQRACACGSSGGSDCTCDEAEQRNSDDDQLEILEAPLEPMFRSAIGDSAPNAPPSVTNGLASSGEPLAEPARGDFEQRFGYDFSGVRVHRDPLAARSASEVHA